MEKEFEILLSYIDYASLNNKENVDEVYKALEHIKAENAHLKAQVPKWISVNDRLPTKEDADDYGKVWVGKSGCSPVISTHYENVSKSSTLNVWMPKAVIKPPPPTEESSATEKENG